MPAERVSSHEEVLKDFDAKVQDCTVTGTCGRPFVRIEMLKRWLDEHKNELRYAAYRQQLESQVEPDIHIGHLQTKNDSLLVFSILLELKHGDLVHCFHETRYLERPLPIEREALEMVFQSSGSGMSETEVNRLVELFDQRQWSYCPLKFCLHAKNRFKSTQIIPILKKERINTKGGMATVWQIEVLEEFVDESLREVVPRSRFESLSKGAGYCYNFALKEFESKRQAEYRNEINAFRDLEGNKGIIRYLCGYEHEDPKTKIPKYNILLEFGELDLDEFFYDKGRLPPLLPTEIQGFWKEIFEVATALRGLHTIKKKRAGVSEEYIGWHADIKPDNILIVEGRFKLADPGFAKFEKHTAKKLLADDTTTIRGGTKTYGPPECYVGPRRSKNAGELRVSRAIDIWSLGCVLSIAASWVVLGIPGLLQATKIRKRANRKILEEDPEANIEKGDFFHDGKDVLKDILHWHFHLTQACRKSDNITGEVLKLVAKMLRGDPKQRINAEALCEEFSQILMQSQKSHQISLPKSLRDALSEIDAEARSPHQESRLEAPFPAANLGVDSQQQDRKIRKSKITVHLSKTTLRPEALDAENISRSATSRKIPPETSPASQHGDPNAIGSQSATPRTADRGNRDAPAPNQETNHARKQGSLGGQPTLYRYGTSATSIQNPGKQSAASSYGVQNVWQARLDIGRRANWRGRTPKDQLLTKHFGRNRDIKFLIDNGESMAEHWDEAIYLLETLVMKAKGQDPNGMDLSFTNGDVELSNNDSPSKFKEKMEDAGAKPLNGLHTNIQTSLGEMLNNYLRKVQGSTQYYRPNSIKKLTILVFTDGKWDGMANKFAVEESIVMFANEMKKIPGNGLRVRQLSIGFIQFGFDLDATYRLQRLDDDLHLEDIPDFIDTEPSRGDVNKMLLGSFVEEYDDKQNEEVIIIPSTPISRSNYFEGISHGRESTYTASQSMQTSPPQMAETSPPIPGQVPRTDTARTVRQMSGANHQIPVLNLPREGSG